MRRVLPLYAVLSLAFAPAPLPKPIPKALKAMQGHWTVQDWGFAAPKEQAVLLRGPWLRRKPKDEVVIIPGFAEVVGSNMAFSTNGKITSRWLLHAVIDRGAGNASVLDLVQPQGRSKMQGIYKIEGDTLTICYRDPGRHRPDVFSNEGQWRLVLKRKKP
jgi:uncharacterized protein (TIGR03067 family)